MPKLWPAPLTAQKISVFSDSDAVTIVPFASTRRMETMLSFKYPYLPCKRPIPAPRDIPKTPVQGQDPTAVYHIMLWIGVDGDNVVLTHFHTFGEGSICEFASCYPATYCHLLFRGVILHCVQSPHVDYNSVLDCS